MCRGGVPSRSGQLARTSSWLAPIPPEVTSTTGASSANSPTAVRELFCPRRASLGSSSSPRTPVTAPPPTVRASTLWRKRSSTRPRARASPTRRRNGSSTPGAGAPGEVEARHGVAVPGGEVAAALGPADVGHELDALLGEPRALLARREVDVGLGPSPRPLVLRAVEAGGAEPVLPRELARVADPQPPLLRAVDEHQPAQRPERLPAERRLGLLVDQDHPPARVRELRGGDQSREPGSHHDRVESVRHPAVVSDRDR